MFVAQYFNESRIPVSHVPLYYMYMYLRPFTVAQCMLRGFYADDGQIACYNEALCVEGMAQWGIQEQLLLAEAI